MHSTQVPPEHSRHGPQAAPFWTAWQVPVVGLHAWHTGQVTFTAPCVQVPFWQVSSVHRLPVSHGVPFVAFCVTHTPVAGTQTLTLHGSVLAGQVLAEPDWHVPFWHVSFSVHRLPSSHGVPFAAFCVTQLPVTGSQTLTLHGSVLAGQVFVGPPWQTPFWHVSSVHRLLSLSHGVPLGLNPFAGH